jgi:hypothetical protein
VVEFAWPTVAERYRTVYSSVLEKAGVDDRTDHEFSPPRGESVS